MIREYSLKADGNKYVSKNFQVKEFACKDGTDKILIDDALVTLLQQARDFFGRAIKLNSAYRTAKYNRKIGGASNSMHVQGRAADIVVVGVPAWVVAAYYDKVNYMGGVGKYTNFTHADARGYKSRWTGSAPSKGIAGFNLGAVYENYKA